MFATVDHQNSRPHRHLTATDSNRPPDRMLAAPWRRLFLAAFWAIPGTWLLLSCVIV